MESPYGVLERVEGSSNVAAIGFDAERSAIVVQFHSGHVYRHGPIALDLAAEFYAAQSKGRFYAQSIKGKIHGEKLSGACSQCEGIGPHGQRCDLCGCAVFDRDWKPAKKGER